MTLAIVDDDRSVRRALGRLLSAYGFDVELYSGAEHFLEARQTHHFDCLVIDLHMPGCSGFDVLRQIQTDNPRLPAIAITGHDVPGSEASALALGATALLSKPIKAEPLLAAIETAVQGK